MIYPKSISSHRSRDVGTIIARSSPAVPPTNARYALHHFPMSWIGKRGTCCYCNMGLPGSLTLAAS